MQFKFKGNSIDTQSMGRTTGGNSHNSYFMANTWTIMFSWYCNFVAYNSIAELVWTIFCQNKVCILSIFEFYIYLSNYVPRDIEYFGDM